eukprot:CAMPEP_0172544322 /NCGR_PEP_ID=MMETSP1067-20121228/14505_1 /TAXON_ID=265564 ORGANISM="Thalassiosira punctigera, Strain Tpunct2005C2" /NCGR_SAMPLE_ID=MMETSP1067 /ASSEMBLY_ACC=CAM_ASM_000444 /LENGTH=610 /DNA_ID=CAMNT_0013330861 /DNA_START=181 /DNA_END=2013 /DNA_ORIENTATION=-
MCKPAGGDGKETAHDVVPRTNYALSSVPVLPSFARNLLKLLRPPFTARKVLLILFLASFLSLASLYAFHRGFRRTVQFWRGMAPLVARYKYVKFRAERIDQCDPEELERRLNVYRETSAPRIVELILRMGGIYVKIGQVMSTIGQGLLPQQYVDALRPLQDGVPPRSYDEISAIVEDSTGRTMHDLFESFDETPIGAASVAQVHRATLRPRQEGEEAMPIVLKVQYPEVAELFEADLSNLEIATRLFAPENLEVAKSLRKRHENELDFTKEAENLRECTRDMQKYGVEPSLVRIPRVVEDICTPNVLAMEYLEGVSLSDAIKQEQDRVAKAFGKQDGEELKRVLASRMREHFEKGGGAGSGGMNMLGDRKMKILNLFGPTASAAIRTYASVKDGMENAAISFAKFGSRLRMGRGQDNLALVADGGQNKKKANVNLGRALKTLVHVHGIQLLLSGTYNADPHPGNILLLPDGRLGLLDYGMVGRLSTKDREVAAETILALSNRDKAATAKIYRDSGYKVSFRDGSAVDDAVLHRFASFHLDRIDLSPLKLDNGETIDLMKLLHSTREQVVPSWVEEGRRLGGLLMGVNAQAARPISLAKEWRPIAKEALRK